MNTKLASEELDRTLVLENPARYFFATNKIKISKTKVVFIGDNDGRKIEFKKSSGRTDSIQITTSREEVEKKQCSLGCWHETNKKESKYEWFDIPQDQVDSFIEWLQTGSWHEVMQKTPPHVKVCKDAIEIFKAIENIDSLKLFKDSIKKIRYKMENTI